MFTTGPGGAGRQWGWQGASEDKEPAEFSLTVEKSGQASYGRMCEKELERPRFGSV